MDQLARAPVLSIFLQLFDLAVQPLWPVVGFPMLFVCFD